MINTVYSSTSGHVSGSKSVGDYFSMSERVKSLRRGWGSARLALIRGWSRTSRRGHITPLIRGTPLEWDLPRLNGQAV